MSKLYIFIIISCLWTGCAGNDSEPTSSPGQPTATNADSSIRLVDAQTQKMMEEVKYLQQLFSGAQRVFNANGKLLKEIRIDEDGNISGSNIYKKIRIWHSDDANRLILLKGTDDLNADRDTFEFEEKSGRAYLYMSFPGKGGSRIKGELMYTFEKGK